MSISSGYTKKAPIGAFFVFVFWLLCPAAIVVACDGLGSTVEGESAGTEEWVQLAYVYDGDTLRLKDGRKIRLLGVNTPELGWPSRHASPRSAQPLSGEAKQAVKDFLAGSKDIRLVYDRERKDRYRRTLAHVYRRDGRNLERYLLALGLAFHIVIPPNLSLAKCLAAAENQARQKNLGVWAESYWQPLLSTRLPVLPNRTAAQQTGFRRIEGRVMSVSSSTRPKTIVNTVWLELEGAIAIRVSVADQQHFITSDNKQYDWMQLLHKRIQVSGWLVNRRAFKGYKTQDRYRPFMVSLRTPFALHILPDD